MKRLPARALKCIAGRARRWCIEKGIYHPQENEALLNGPLLPIKGLLVWLGRLVDRLALCLGGLGLFISGLKLAKLGPFSHLTWWRALAPLWAGVPITVAVAGAVAIAAAIFVYPFAGEGD